MRRILFTILALTTLGACSSATETGTPPPPTEVATTVTEPATTTASTEPPAPTYAPWEQVDPFTSRYFIELEDTNLAVDQGEQRLYGLGVGVCQHLDLGRSIDGELAGLITDAALAANDAGQLVGAAVTDLCPHHRPLVDEYLADN